MRKIFRHALTGVVVASFSSFAAAQSVTANPSTGDTTISPNVQTNPQLGNGNQSSQQSGSDNQSTQSQAASGASEDKNPNSPGKGYAKGHERGKGNQQGYGNSNSQNQSGYQGGSTYRQ